MSVKEIIYQGLYGRSKENFRKTQLKSIPVNKHKKNMTATEFTNNIKNNVDNLMN